MVYEDAVIVVELRVNGATVRCAARKIRGPHVVAFEPMDVCSDALMATLARGGATEGSARVVRAMRKGYADELARELAAALVSAMEADDLRNGYGGSRAEA